MAERTKSGGAPAPSTQKRGGGLTAPNAWGGTEPHAGGLRRAGALVGEAADLWVDALAAVVGAGYGIVVSGTSDGGAVRIALLDDGETTKKYAGGADDLRSLLIDLRDYARAHGVEREGAK